MSAAPDTTLLLKFIPTAVCEREATLHVNAEHQKASELLNQIQFPMSLIYGKEVNLGQPSLISDSL